MRGLLSAWQFMTVFRLPRRWQSERSLVLAPQWFPVVGLILGTMLAGADLVLSRVFALTICSALEIILPLAWTGGLHMDGLADTADGFLSSRSREKTLEIMRDSRSGAMAVMCVSCVILLKWAALNELRGDSRFWILLLAPSLGRSVILMMMSALPYARREQGGMATAFAAGAAPWSWMVALAVITMVAVALWSYKGFALVGGGVAVALLFFQVSRKKIGGYTGDTLGAACELTEAAVFLFAAGLALETA